MMNDHLPPPLPAKTILGNEALWSEPDPQMEAAILDSIGAAAADEAQTGNRTTADFAPVVKLSSRKKHSWLTPIAAGIAAGLLVVLGFGFASNLGDSETPQPPVAQLALAGTPHAPDASANAVLMDTPDGTAISLTISGLAPAAPGTYYEAWMGKSAAQLISAGTFHFRGGTAPVDLWSGVSPVDYPMFMVTLQVEDAGPEPSGTPVLIGAM